MWLDPDIRLTKAKADKQFRDILAAVDRSKDSCWKVVYVVRRYELQREHEQVPSWSRDETKHPRLFNGHRKARKAQTRLAPTCPTRFTPVLVPLPLITTWRYILECEIAVFDSIQLVERKRLILCITALDPVSPTYLDSSRSQPSACFHNHCLFFNYT